MGILLSKAASNPESESLNPINETLETIIRGSFDPRSPFSNRTPLAFTDNHRKSNDLNLNDTFADLFVIKKYDVKQSEAEARNSGHNFAVAEKFLVDKPEVIPDMLNKELDPRSPSVGIQRTPLVLNEGDVEQKDNALENTFATLSVVDTKPIYKDLQSTPKNLGLRNKRLELVKGGKRRQGTSQFIKQHGETCEDKENNKSGLLQSPLAKEKGVFRIPLGSLNNQQTPKTPLGKFDSPRKQHRSDDVLTPIKNL